MTTPRELEYHATLEAVALAMRILAQWDLGLILDAIERADAAGPMLDPTLRDKAKAMHEDQEILRAALPLWNLARELDAKRVSRERPVVTYRWKICPSVKGRRAHLFASVTSPYGDPWSVCGHARAPARRLHRGGLVCSHCAAFAERNGIVARLYRTDGLAVERDGWTL